MMLVEGFTNHRTCLAVVALALVAAMVVCLVLVAQGDRAAMGALGQQA
jgi:hypothetical protein